MSVEKLYRHLITILQVLRVWNPCQLVGAYHRKIRELVARARVKEDYLPLFAAVLLEALGLTVLLFGVVGLFTEPRAALVVIPVLAGFYAINKYYDVFGSSQVRTASVWWLVLVTSLSAVLYTSLPTSLLQGVTSLPVTAQNSILLRGIGIISIWVAMTRLVPFDAIRLGTRITKNQPRAVELPRPVALHVVPYRFYPLAWLVAIYVVASLGLLSLVVQLPVTGWWAVSLFPSLVGFVYIVRMAVDYVVWRRGEPNKP